ncbi:MAG: carboxypeptidase regulatory-like domain-containing protein [Acidobacteria bacterium]|nr:carboxypeptidase regulatory-like domain-containing protein [Acidobacteriota bacterium]
MQQLTHRRLIGPSSSLAWLALAAGLGLAVSGIEAAAGQAGIQGEIIGHVSDATGAVMPGVSVTLSGAAMMGAQETVSDDAGGYRFGGVPPGAGYVLRHELAGFTTVVREGIVVTARATTTVAVTLGVAAVAETITVSGAAPLVDTTSARQGASITKDLLELIPTGRDPYAILAMAPGIVRVTPNVGGSGADQLQNTVYAGTTARRMNIAGAETAVRFWDGRYMNFDAYEEVVVETAGAGADIRRPGGGYSMELVPRSGGNRLQGNISFFGIDKAMTASNIDDRLRADGVSEGGNTDSLHDVSVNIGGPFVKDRLWWFASARHFRTFRHVLGIPQLEEGVLIPTVMNVTAQLNPQHRLQGFWSWSAKRSPQRDMSRFIAPEASYNQDSTDQLKQIKWLGAFGDNFVELQGFMYDTWWPSYPQAGSGAPMKDLATGLSFHGQYNDFTKRDFDRYQSSGSLSRHVADWLGASHDLKLGFDWQTHRYDEDIEVGQGSDSQVRYELRNGAPAFAVLYNSPVTLNRNSDGLSLYLQDRINLARLTVGAGLRWDYYNAWWPAQGSPDGNRFEAIFGRLDIAKNGKVLTWQNVAPRFSAVYRLTADGSTVVNAAYGRFPGEMDPSLHTDFIHPSGLRWQRHVWYGDENGNDVLDLAEIGSLVNQFVPRDNRLDPDLENPTTEEVSASLNRDLGGSMALKVNYVYARYLETINLVGINAAVPSSAYRPMEITDPGPDGVRSTGDDRPLTVYNLDAAYVGKASFLRTNLPGAQRKAHSFNVQLQKRLSNNWQFLVGYGFSRTSETANVDFTNPNALINAEGRADIDTPHSFSLTGSYQLPHDVVLSANWNLRSGMPYDRVLQVFGLRQGSISVRADPLGTYRHDSMNMLDFRVEKGFRAATGRLALLVEVFNTLNTNASMDVGVGGLGRGTVTGGNFGKVAIVAPPRTLRLGARFTF